MNHSRPAIIAVASGKGGTGKTTLAAHLALASSRTRETLLVDLDVEAPDALGYFPRAGVISAPAPVHIQVPRLVAARCTGCGRCASSCRFGAIVALGRVVTIADAVCKGCGRCVAACPGRALEERPAEVGSLQMRRYGRLILLEGRMTIGDIRSTAVIEAAKARAAECERRVEIRDCPPGVTCPTTHAIEGADFVVLVAEPTEFSLHDLGAAIELVRGLGIESGVVVNKDGFGGADVDAVCASRGVPVIGRVAFDADRAAAGAAGRLWTEDPGFMGEMGLVLETALRQTPVAAGGLP